MYKHAYNTTHYCDNDDTHRSTHLKSCIGVVIVMKLSTHVIIQDKKAYKNKLKITVNAFILSQIKLYWLI